MIETLELLPGITLRCVRDSRFKQGCLSIQFLRPMRREESAANALLPAVLLRGTEKHPDLRAITWKLDDLYGAAVGTMVHRIGDYQTTGLHCSFMEDRFALDGDAILTPMAEFLNELLLQPKLENGGFCRDFVEGEKKNLISTIESERNDKRVYCANQLLRLMCRGDSFGIPRLGEKEQVAALDGGSLYRHYQKVLKESAVAAFYVGSAPAQQVAALVKDIFTGVDRDYVNLPAQTPFHDVGGGDETETMEIAQGKLCMGFVTSITNRAPEFAAMQVLNTVFGGGMTSKLFMHIREKLSLCYAIGSTYYGTKGIMTVSAGIDSEKEPLARKEILNQLDLCRQGSITPEELDAAKQAILSGLRGVTDSPGSIENFCSTNAISGFPLSLQEYMEAVESVTMEQVVACANTVQTHSSFFLKGVTA